VKFYRTGEVGDREAYDVAWVSDRESTVDTINGFIEVYLDARGANDVSLVITGGFRTSSDIAKALAMGADAVAIASAALIAIGCQQYRICDTGRCPVGITTQDPELRSRLDIKRSAERLANFFRVLTAELEDFARLTGRDDVHRLDLSDLRTTSPAIAKYTGIAHVGEPDPLN